MHCGAFASGDDSDEAVQPREPCNHNSNPCNLSDINYCIFIAPDLRQGDGNRCFGCFNTREETKQWKNAKIHRCSLFGTCPMWIHDKFYTRKCGSVNFRNKDFGLRVASFRAYNMRDQNNNPPRNLSVWERLLECIRASALFRT